MSLFDKNASEPLAARVGRLSAKEIRVPELVVEQTFANQRQTTRYRNIVVADVAKGRIASATSEGGTMEMKGGKSPGSGTMGRLTMTDVDVAEAARIYAEKAATPGAMKKIYGGFTLENLAVVPEDGPQFKLARISGKDFAARATKSSWMETMKAFASIEDLDKASSAEQSRVFGAIADVFDSMEIGLVEATGIEIMPPKEKGKEAGRIARIAYSGGGGKPADMRMERFEIATDQGRAKIDLIAFTGFSFTGTFKGLRDLEGKPAKDLDMASLRQLIPTIGTIRISGVDFDMPDSDKKGPVLENIKFSVKDMEVTADQPLNGIPTNLRVGVDSFRFVIPPGVTEDGLKELAALGYKELDLSWLTAATWNAATNELQLRELSMRGANMGSTNLRATIGGVTKDVFSPDNAMALVALLGATVKSADFRIENGGLVEKLHRPGGGEAEEVAGRSAQGVRHGGGGRDSGDARQLRPGEGDRPGGGALRRQARQALDRREDQGSGRARHRRPRLDRRAGRDPRQARGHRDGRVTATPSPLPARRSGDQAAAAVSPASRRTSSQRDTKASTQAGSKWLPALASRWARASASGQAFL